ncbi:MAG: SH3 domain-containing protein [Synergistaceae bacterium]|nr:SH3 domain-containing protein [Synergistaceae bacterium]
MRKIFAALIVAVMFCGSAYAERFSNFPAYGICMGDSVRCRENPGKKSKIIKRINKGDEVQVVGQRTAGGELWYEVYTSPDSEDEEGPFWVSARYIEPEH